MSGNVDAKLAAGTTVSCDEAVPETFVAVAGIETLGAIGDSTEAKEKTTLADKRKVYGAGLTDSPDMEIGGIYLVEDAQQKAFIDACKAKKPFNIQVEWPDGAADTNEGATVGTFLFQPFGFMIAESQSAEWIKFTISGKQNSDVIWTTKAAA